MCVIHNTLLINGKCEKCSPKINDLTTEEKHELTRIIKQSYPEIKENEDSINKIINWYVQSNRKHFIIFTDLKLSAIFIHHHEFQKKFTIIEVNTSHPFYEKFIHQLLQKEDDEELIPFLLFIASWIESERKDYSNSMVLERFRSTFGVNLMDIIANWNIQ